MEENKIKEAAEKYMKSDELRYFQDPCDLDVKDAFIAGANWVLNNQWNNVDEILPKRKTTVFVILENGDDDICYFNEYDRFCARINQSLKVKYWMSIPDLPKKLKTMKFEKCRLCVYAIFDTQIIGWINRNGRELELREKENYPSSCSYGIDGARPIDNYCPKEIDKNEVYRRLSRTCR